MSLSACWALCEFECDRVDVEGDWWVEKELRASSIATFLRGSSASELSCDDRLLTVT